MTNYLQSVCNIIYYVVPERKELIEEIHLTGKNGHLVRDLETLNAYLKSENIPYRILQITARKQGVKNPYRSAWKVIAVPQKTEKSK